MEPHDLFLSHGKVEWTSKVKYLGLLIESYNGFRCSNSATLGKFDGSLNGIMRFRVKPSTDVQVKLLMSHCTPILTYGIEVFEFSAAEFQQMRMAYNTVFRKVYGYRRNESVAEIILTGGFQRWDDMVLSRRDNFLRKKRSSSNVLVATLANS